MAARTFTVLPLRERAGIRINGGNVIPAGMSMIGVDADLSRPAGLSDDRRQDGEQTIDLGLGGAVAH